MKIYMGKAIFHTRGGQLRGLYLYVSIAFCFFFLLNLLPDDVSFLRVSLIRNAVQQKPTSLIYASGSKMKNMIPNISLLCFRNEGITRIIIQSSLTETWKGENKIYTF